MRELGLTTVFGNPGSTEAAFLQDWPADFTYVLGLQEASVVAMADGWSRVNRRPALVNLHTAAGVGNAMGNLANAWHNRTPLIVLAGQQTREMLLLEPWLTNIDAVSLPRPYVKFAYEPARAQDVPAALMRAFAIASQPPQGPVFLSVPMDDWTKAASGSPVAARPIQTRLAASSELLAPLAAALDSSARPALIVGGGVARSEGWQSAVELAERLRCDVFAAPADGVGFPQDHELFCGALPSAVAPLRATLDPYDVVVVAGAPVFRYYPHVPGDYLPEGASLFHISDDPAEIARAPVGCGVLADPGGALAVLHGLVTPRPRRELRRRPEPAVALPVQGRMTVAALMRALAAQRPPHAILVNEAPTALQAVAQEWPCVEPDTFFFPEGGGLGYGLPAAVGIALAERQSSRMRPVVALIGDGSFHYSVQALYTASSLALPLIVVVPENGGYGILKQFASSAGLENVPGLDLEQTDAAAIARGYGCSALVATTPEAVRQAFASALSRGGPTVIVAPVADSASPLL